MNDKEYSEFADNIHKTMYNTRKDNKKIFAIVTSKEKIDCLVKYIKKTVAMIKECLRPEVTSPSASFPNTIPANIP